MDRHREIRMQATARWVASLGTGKKTLIACITQEYADQLRGAVLAECGGLWPAGVTIEVNDKLRGQAIEYVTLDEYATV